MLNNILGFMLWLIGGNGALRGWIAGSYVICCNIFDHNGTTTNYGMVSNSDRADNACIAAYVHVITDDR